MSKKRSRYAGRTSVSLKKRRIWLWVGICAVAVLLTVGIAIGVGAWLRSKAESFEPKEEITFEGNTPPKESIAEAVYAPMFEYGDSPYDVVRRGYTAVSLPLVYRDGSIAFDSAVCREYGGEYDPDVSIEEYSRIFEDNGLKYCGYFNSTAFAIEDKTMRELRKAYEIALIREAVSLGVDDVLILGIDVNEENSDEVAAYLSELSQSVDAPVGIAISTGVLMLTEEEKYVAGKLYSACDYISLDLRELSFSEEDSVQSIGEYLDSFGYYLSAYSLRLVFSSKTTDFFEEVYSLGLTNAQVTRTYN